MGSKVIKISTSDEITIHDYPSSLKGFYNLIGCRVVEHVMPNRLYSVLQMSNTATASHPGRCVSMLVDEEGLLKNNPRINAVGSYLYETDKHHHPIVGNIVIIGEVYTDDGVEFCGIDDTVFYDLFQSLDTLCDIAKGRETI